MCSFFPPLLLDMSDHNNLIRDAYNRFLRRNKRLVPNQYQLLTEVKALSKKKKISRLPKEISLKNVKQFLDEKKPIIQYETPRRIRPKQFQTIPIIKLGVYHADHSFFHPNLAQFNDGHTGFMVFVENFTNRLFVHPSRLSDKVGWTNAVEAFMRQVDHVSIIYSDCDPVPGKSRTWREQVTQKYGFTWRFVRRPPKAFLAERFVGYVKQKLSASLLSESERKKEPALRWVDMVKPLWQNYNKQKILHTSFRRDQVTPNNFETFLSQLKKDAEPEMNFHMSRAGPFSIERWNRRLFKFDLNQRVYILKKIDWTVFHGKRKFLKGTQDGTWELTKTFTISGRQLRASKNGDLIPVYALKEFDDVDYMGDDYRMQHFWFYENQLRAAGPTV